MNFQDVLQQLEEANINIMKSSASHDEKMINVYLDTNLTLHVIEHCRVDYDTPFRREEITYLSFEIKHEGDFLCWSDLKNNTFEGPANDLEGLIGTEFRESEFGQLKLAIRRMLSC